mmetsp:Transcript_22735/g.63912  ORF Transcript_22735/g.63912 Transcript_22735/m.63912 type:complete len:215 (-) Transcript_22735:722-1366(-)
MFRVDPPLGAQLQRVVPQPAGPSENPRAVNDLTPTRNKRAVWQIVILADAFYVQGYRGVKAKDLHDEPFREVQLLHVIIIRHPPVQCRSNLFHNTCLHVGVSAELVDGPRQQTRRCVTASNNKIKANVTAKFHIQFLVLLVGHLHKLSKQVLESATVLCSLSAFFELLLSLSQHVKNRTVQSGSTLCHISFELSQLELFGNPKVADRKHTTPGS